MAATKTSPIYNDAVSSVALINTRVLYTMKVWTLIIFLNLQSLDDTWKNRCIFPTLFFTRTSAKNTFSHGKSVFASYLFVKKIFNHVILLKPLILIILYTCLTFKEPLQQDTFILVVIWPSSHLPYQNGCPTIMPTLQSNLDAPQFTLGGQPGWKEIYILSWIPSINNISCKFSPKFNFRETIYTNW